MKNKHQQKRDNMQMITNLKQRIKDKGDEVDDKEFNRIMQIN